jgi:glutathione synthase/RimK-type ligase-like ATP-grasp enzyme
MQRVAYLTTKDLVGFPIDDAATIGPLDELGFVVEVVDWRSPEDWGRFAAVIPRSPWDYHLFPEEFFTVLERIESSPARLFNGLEVMRWNSDKSYLGDLASRGLQVVQTEFGDRIDPGRLTELRGRFGRDLVLKPAVGASAGDTFLLRDGDDPSEALATLDGRAWLAQPFMPGIVDEGEYSLIYFDREFSHALLKVPGRGDFRVQEDRGGTIQPVTPEPLLLEQSGEVLRTLPDDLLYTRIDLVRDGDGFALMEAELIEPALYFSMDQRAPQRFARALAGRLDSGA